MLRQEAIRRGLTLATFVVLLDDGAEGLANMGRLCFPTAVQIVDFYHAMEHARKVLLALLGSKERAGDKKADADLECKALVRFPWRNERLSDELAACQFIF